MSQLGGYIKVKSLAFMSPRFVLSCYVTTCGMQDSWGMTVKCWLLKPSQQSCVWIRPELISPAVLQQLKYVQRDHHLASNTHAFLLTSVGLCRLEKFLGVNLNNFPNVTHQMTFRTKSCQNYEEENKRNTPGAGLYKLGETNPSHHSPSISMTASYSQKFTESTYSQGLAVRKWPV